MKNTKILFIRLYIGTLYSNFIVPLRGSNYIQLLYGGFQQGLVFLSERIQRLVWQEHINELGQCSGRIRAVFDAKNITQVSSKYHHQNTTETPPEITTGRVQMSVNGYGFKPKEIGSIRVKSGQKIGVDRCKSVRISTDLGTKIQANESSYRRKIGTNRDTSGRKMSVECYQMRPNATKCDHE